MEKRKEFIKNSSIILFGKFFTQFVIFLLLPLYTNVLSTKEYGTVDLIITYVNLIAPLASLQLENAVFRYLIENRTNNENKKRYISTSFYILIISIVLIISLVLIVDFIFKIQYIPYFILLITSTMIVNYFLQIARGIGDNISYAIGSMIVGISNAILIIITLLLLKLGVEGMLTSQIIANIIGALFILNKNKIHHFISKKHIEKEKAKTLLSYSFPLIPNSVCWWILNVSDRTIISLLINVGQNGIYSISNKFSNAYLTIFQMVSLAWTESVSLHINDKNKDNFFSETMNDLLRIFASLMLEIIVIIPFIFPILINKNYNDAYIYIPLLMLGSFFNVIIGILSGFYIAKKMTKTIAKTTLVSAILNIVLNLILIGKLKVWAAVISTVIAFAIIAIYRYIDVKKYIKIKIKKSFVISLAIIFIVAHILYLYNNLYLNIINLLLITIYSIIVNRKSINTIKNIIKNHKIYKSNKKFT